MDTARVVNEVLAESNLRRGNIPTEALKEIEEYKGHFVDEMHLNAYFWKKFLIPRRFQGKSLHDFVTSQTADIANAVNAIQHNQSVVLVGDCGVGKTHLAVALMYEWMKANVFISKSPTDSKPKIDWERMGTPRFVVCPEMFLEIKSTFGKESGGSEKSILDYYANVPLLVIDDFASEKVTEWVRTDLYVLVNHRYLCMLPTIITSNKSLNEIAGEIDDRISSRFSEMGIVIKLESKDHRLNSIR